MPEAERRFSMGRLEAFSDGVIAVIITIMALELKAPERSETAALWRFWPSFAIYLVSFRIRGDLLDQSPQSASKRRARDCSAYLGQQRAPVLPVAPTAHVADTHLGPFPAMFFGALQFICGLAYNLVFLIAARRRVASQPPDASGCTHNVLALLVYALGTAVAFVSPRLTRLPMSFPAFSPKFLTLSKPRPPEFLPPTAIEHRPEISSEAHRAEAMALRTHHIRLHFIRSRPRNPSSIWIRNFARIAVVPRDTHCQAQ
jgi:uncharacterized membrane protein